MADSPLSRRKLAFIAASLVVVALGIGAYFSFRGNGEPEPVRIGYQATALYRHLFTAAELGYFEDEGVNVELSRHVSANRMMEGIISDQLDVTGLTNLQVALAVEAKDPGRFRFANMLVWRESSYPDYILVRSDSGIGTPAQLVGRTLGLHPGSAVRAFATAVLQQYEVDVNQVTLQELQPGIMGSAFVSRAVDAIYCMDPAATSILDTGEATVLVSNPMSLIFSPPVPISGTALSETFLQSRPEDAQRVVRALDRAIGYLRHEGTEDEVAGYISKYTDIPADQARRMNISEYWLLSEVDRDRVQQLADKFHELGIVDSRVQVEGLFMQPIREEE